ncbi:MAG TPA: glycosyltransferase [Gaiellaceae bacterium]|nr:glycosyltransferase [Gaiellaceae bacterium]
MTRVSFVMPAWKPSPAYIRRAVASVLREPGVDVELVVVDDGSPEPVAGMLAGIADARLRIIRVEHGGVSRARNAGTAAVSGDYVRFVDADDVLVPGGTARLLRHAAGADDVIGYGATLVCDEALRPVWTMKTSVQGDAVVACLLGLFLVRPFSLLFPRRVLEATGDWDPGFTVAEDWDFVLRAVEHAAVRGDKEPVTLYRRHPASATADLAAGERGAYRVVERYFERHPDQRGTRLERRARGRIEAQAARVLLTHGSVRPALRRLRRSDPVSVVQELRQAPLALAGKIRHRLRPGPSLEDAL